MNRSENINEFVAALAKAQAVMEPAELDATNDFFGGKPYATLHAIMVAARPLSANGIAIVQSSRCCVEKKVVTVETLLAHSSGQWISETLDMPVDRATSQGVGSAISYGRKYGLAGLAGVSAAAGDQDDDDGNAAAGLNSELARPAAPALTDAEKTVVNTLRQTITTCSDFNVLVKIGEQIKTEFSTGVQSAIREFYRAKHAVLKPKESANEPAN